MGDLRMLRDLSWSSCGSNRSIRGFTRLDRTCCSPQLGLPQVMRHTWNARAEARCRFEAG
jgi:hypothetical protein